MYLGLTYVFQLQSPMTPQIPSNEFPPPQDNEMMMTMLTTFATLTSRSTVGVLIISGLVSSSLFTWKRLFTIKSYQE